MTLVVLLIVSTLIAGTGTAVMWRWSGATGATAPSALGTARKAGIAMRLHPSFGAALAKRLDPRAATGLALTLALLVIVCGGVLLGVLAYLVRVGLLFAFGGWGIEDLRTDWGALVAVLAAFVAAGRLRW